MSLFLVHSNVEGAMGTHLNRCLRSHRRSYRPSLPLTHLSSELGFSAIAEAHEFLKNHSIAVYIDPSPPELSDTARPPAPSGSGRKKRHNHGAQPPPPPPPQLPLEQRRWDAKAALPGVIAAAEKYRKIDVSRLDREGRVRPTPDGSG